MSRLTAIAVCVLLTLSATGQHRKYTVVLNNGSRVSGTIVGDTAGYLDIKVLTPQVIRIGKSQVSSVEALKYPVKRSMKTSGYYVRFSTGFLSGKNESGNQSSLSFHLSNGYQFKNGIAVGIGSGMEELGVVLVPLYADLRYTPLNSGLSPYIWLKTGHGFAITDQAVSYVDDAASADNGHEGGFLFNAGVGISLFYMEENCNKRRYRIQVPESYLKRGSLVVGKKLGQAYCNRVLQTGVPSGFCLHVKEEI